MRKNVNIILGSMRSGTTIIHKSLCQGENTNPYISESWFLVDLLRLYHWGLERYEIRHSDQFGAVDNFQNLIQHNINYYISAVSIKYQDPEVLFLKHPELSYYALDLILAIKDLKFIVIVRDPRDVIASIYKVKERHIKSKIVTPQTQTQDIEAHCKNYLNYYKEIFKHQKFINKRIIFVKYEDFILNTESEIERISLFTNAKYNIEKVKNSENCDTKSLNFDRNKRMKDPLSSGFWSEDYLKPLTDKNIGDYKNILPASDIDFIENYLYDFGKNFGYWKDQK